MRDPFSKYIKSNKDKLDTYVPDSSNWDAIEQRIQKKKNRKRFIWIASSAAAVVLAFFILRDNSMVGTEMVISETPVSDATEAPREDRNLIQWESEKDVVYKESNRKKTSESIITSFYDGTVNYSISANQAAFSTMDVDANSYQWNNGNQSSGNQRKEEEYIAPEEKYEVDHYYEYYEKFKENPFESPYSKPLSTFGIDVDGAGYSNVRRFVRSGFLPPKNAVKLEEMVNYFNYDLPEPTGSHPFSITTEVGKCPWEKDHLLLQVALKGKSIDFKETQSNNLVFLIDVSGSMSDRDKLPLLKQSMKMIVQEMDADDKIAIVVYAGAAGLALPSTSGKYKEKIYEAIESLSTGGSTAGGEGIELAYKLAQEEFLKKGNNRILLATDGDFNVGVSDDNALVELIEEKRESGIFLSVLGFGTGNLQSSKMEKIADNGNGNYSYIDNLMEAKKVLVDEIGGTFVTIAKDVKLQVEFNQDYVKSYRLLGYENRVMESRDFDDDTKDSGDLGSGHTVVAIYEIVLQEDKDAQPAQNLRYQTRGSGNSKGVKDELAFIKFRYKKPSSSRSILLSKKVNYEVRKDNSDNFLFASAVAEFGMLLRESKYRSDASFNKVIARASRSRGKDKFGYRAEFVSIAQEARKLMLEYVSSTSYRNR
ncbi:MAG: von Willebrand factor type A domain-containing protein [Crocinitomicaceae bacterium]